MAAVVRRLAGLALAFSHPRIVRRRGVRTPGARTTGSRGGVRLPALVSSAIVPIDGAVPEVHPHAWIAPGAVLVGSVRIASEASIWYGCVLRGDLASIEVGSRTNLQDSCVVHADPSFPLVVGSGVSVGHRAVLHGCTIEDDVLVGIGAVVLNGARVGAGSIIGAGAVVTEGVRIPPGSLVAGVPGRVRRALRAEELQSVQDNASLYLRLTALHRAASPVRSPHV